MAETSQIAISTQPLNAEEIVQEVLDRELAEAFRELLSKKLPGLMAGLGIEPLRSWIPANECNDSITMSAPTPE